MKKLKTRLVYDEIYLLPIKRRHIKLGWLNWMNNHKLTNYLSAKKKNYKAADLQKYLEEDDSLTFLACYDSLNNIYFGNLRIYQIRPEILSFGRLIGNLNFQGKGYGTKMCNIALDLCFNNFKAELVVVSNDRKNKSSQISKIKAGFIPADERIRKKYNINSQNTNAFYLTKDMYFKTGF